MKYFKLRLSRCRTLLISHEQTQGDGQDQWEVGRGGGDCSAVAVTKKEDGPRPATVAKKEDEVQSTTPPSPSPKASAVPTASEFLGNPGRPGQLRNFCFFKVVDPDAPTRHRGVVPDRLPVLQEEVLTRREAVHDLVDLVDLRPKRVPAVGDDAFVGDPASEELVVGAEAGGAVAGGVEAEVTP